MPFYLDKEEFESGKALDGGALAKQRKKEGKPVDESEIGLPYRHFKSNVPMLKEREYVKVENKDPKIDEIRGKTTRGQGWDTYEEKEIARVAKAKEREEQKAKREAEKAAKAKEREEQKAKREAEKAAKAEAKKQEKEKEKAEGGSTRQAVTRKKE